MDVKFCSFCEEKLDLDKVYCRFCRNNIDQKLEERFDKPLERYKKIVGAYGKVRLQGSMISMSGTFGLMGQSIVSIYAKPTNGSWLVIGQIREMCEEA